jgi:hypothetical protein
LELEFELELLLELKLELELWFELGLPEAGGTARAGATARAGLAAGPERAPRTWRGLGGGAPLIRGESPALRAMADLVAGSSSERVSSGLNVEPTAMPAAPSAPAQIARILRFSNAISVCLSRSAELSACPKGLDRLSGLNLSHG